MVKSKIVRDLRVNRRRSAILNRPMPGSHPRNVPKFRKTCCFFFFCVGIILRQWFLLLFGCRNGRCRCSVELLKHEKSKIIICRLPDFALCLTVGRVIDSNLPELSITLPKYGNRSVKVTINDKKCGFNVPGEGKLPFETEQTERRCFAEACSKMNLIKVAIQFVARIKCILTGRSNQ